MNPPTRRGKWGTLYDCADHDDGDRHATDRIPWPVRVAAPMGLCPGGGDTASFVSRELSCNLFEAVLHLL